MSKGCGYIVLQPDEAFDVPAGVAPGCRRNIRKGVVFGVLAELVHPDMEKFYFDFEGPGMMIKDDIGLVFPDTESALSEATIALTEFARDALVGVNSGTIRIVVRVGARPVGSVALRLAVEVNPGR